MTTNKLIIYFFILTLTNLSILALTKESIPPEITCASLDCSVLISTGFTNQNRAVSHSNQILRFKSNEKVEVYAKSKDLWGVKIKGKIGFIPKNMIREDAIEVSDLHFNVPSQELYKIKETEASDENLGENHYPTESHEDFSEEYSEQVPALENLKEPSLKIDDDVEDLPPSPLTPSDSSSPLPYTHDLWDESPSEASFRGDDATSIPPVEEELKEDDEESPPSPQAKNNNFDYQKRYPPLGLAYAEPYTQDYPKPNGAPTISTESTPEAVEPPNTSEEKEDTLLPNEVTVTPFKNVFYVQSESETTENSTNPPESPIEIPSSPTISPTESALDAVQSPEVSLNSSYKTNEDLTSKEPQTIETDSFETSVSNMSLSSSGEEESSVVAQENINTTTQMLNSEADLDYHPTEATKLTEEKETPNIYSSSTIQDHLVKITPSLSLPSAEKNTLVNNDTEHVAHSEVSFQTVLKETTTEKLKPIENDLKLESSFVSITAQTSAHLQSSQNIEALLTQSIISSSVTITAQTSAHLQSPQNIEASPTHSIISSSAATSEFAEPIPAKSENREDDPRWFARTTSSIPETNTPKYEQESHSSKEEQDEDEFSSLMITFHTVQEYSQSIFNLLPASTQSYIIGLGLPPRVLVLLALCTIGYILLVAIFKYFEHHSLVRSLRIKVASDSRTIYELTSAKSLFVKELEEESSKVNLLKQENLHYKKEVKPLKNELEMNKAFVQKLQLSYDSLKNEYIEEKETDTKCTAELKEALTEYQSKNEELSKDLNEAQELLITLHESFTRQKAKSESLESENQKMENLVAELIEENTNLEAKCTHLTDENVRLQTRNDEVDSEKTVLQSELTESSTKLSEKETEVKALLKLVDEFSSSKDEEDQTDGGKGRLEKLLEVAQIKLHLAELLELNVTQKARLDELETTNRKISENEIELTKEVEMLKGNWKHAAKENEKLATEFRILSEDSSINENRLSSELKALEEKCHEYAVNAKNAMQNIESLNSDIISLRSQNSQLNTECTDSSIHYTKKLAEEEQKNTNLFVKVQTLKRHNEDLKQETHVLRQKLTSTEKDKETKIKFYVDELHHCQDKLARNQNTNQPPSEPAAEDRSSSSFPPSTAVPPPPPPPMFDMPPFPPPQFMPPMYDLPSMYEPPPHMPPPPFSARGPPPPNWGMPPAYPPPPPHHPSYFEVPDHQRNPSPMMRELPPHHEGSLRGRSERMLGNKDSSPKSHRTERDSIRYSRREDKEDMV